MLQISDLNLILKTGKYIRMETKETTKKGANSSANVTKSNANANALANLSSLAKGLQLPTKGGAGNKGGIYKSEIFADCNPLDATAPKRIRKKIRNERDSHILQGLQVLRNNPENFSDFVAKTWKPFAERVYTNPSVFFEENGRTDAEKLKLLQIFSKALEIVK